MPDCRTHLPAMAARREGEPCEQKHFLLEPECD